MAIPSIRWLHRTAIAIAAAVPIGAFLWAAWWLWSRLAPQWIRDDHGRALGGAPLKRQERLREGGTMRHTPALRLAALVVLATTSGSTMAQSQDAEAIKAANAGFYAALSARDLAALDRVWDHEGQVFNIFGVSKTPMIGWTAVRSGYEDLYNRFPEISVNMTEPSVRQDGNCAVVIGVETQKVRLPSGESASALLPATNVFVKRNGQWLMVHHHSSRPPQ